MMEGGGDGRGGGRGMITVIALEATDLASPAPGRGGDSTHIDRSHTHYHGPPHDWATANLV